MEHLSDAQVKELKQQLTESRQQLRSQIREELVRSDDERYGDLAGQVHDTGDESVADLLVDTNISIVSRYIGELREVEAALERMNTGDYGLCEECGSEIPFERLKAYPTARRDIEHQSRHEQTHAAEGRPKM
jgi:DnaK suppressor protein